MITLIQFTEEMWSPNSRVFSSAQGRECGRRIRLSSLPDRGMWSFRECTIPNGAAVTVR